MKNKGATLGVGPKRVKESECSMCQKNVQMSLLMTKTNPKNDASLNQKECVHPKWTYSYRERDRFVSK